MITDHLDKMLHLAINGSNESANPRVSCGLQSITGKASLRGRVERIFGDLSTELLTRLSDRGRPGFVHPAADETGAAHLTRTN
jgi:glutamate synthase domain-containing protein 1